MDFWGTVLVLFRRWYITLPAFVLALGATLAVYSSVPTNYVSNAVLVLTAPTTGGTLPTDPKNANGLTNPLLNFDKGLSMTASIVIEGLGTPEMMETLGITPDGDTKVQIDNGSSNFESLTESPFVFITGESASPAEAQAVVNRVATNAKKVLADRQKALDAPPSTYITMNFAVPATTPMPEQGQRLRAAAVALALGAVASLTAAFAAESFAQRLRVRRALRPTRRPTKSFAFDNEHSVAGR
ncbi:hypothetical protein GCM10023194_42700 [Planotetraspora phitsanulokensis]|uniref:Polysaccharide chain length determinant N-terminal domain-containing protein n=1 Tax=Planotetraspora phitsanulokensis TaxID=575192 RepID=A0A8J3U6E3_9ACTN|nr:hypothetical protein [Planotetraspora phitsanulokensis]GII37872.1 hypothetical protein Pph01_28750 [Planotetraspora phitsanulokensis]